MQQEIKLLAPKLNANDDDLKVVKIHCEYGQKVHGGTLIADLETTKSVFEFTSNHTGFVYLSVKEGDVVNVGSLLGVIRDKQSSVKVPDFHLNLTAKNATKPALELMRKHNIKAEDIPATKRIREIDVRNFLAESESGKQVLDKGSKVQPHGEGNRLSVATALKKNQDKTVPCSATYNFPFDDESSTLTDKFIFYSSRFLDHYPALNSYFDQGNFVKHDVINVGHVVQVDGMIFMPVIPGANELSLEEIKVLRLEQTMHIFRNNMTKTSTCQPSYCISAITSDHILSHTPILYPKTSIIFGLAFGVAQSSTCTITYDHQITNGGEVTELYNKIVSAF